ncbi:proline--tRNA ligase [bacterium]|nr:proline--tRNA ligase [bacterium]
MKASRMCLKTLKEAPQEAVIDSHILLLRSGMIKKNVAGVYTYMPLGLKVLKKIENIVREEMDAIGSEEILCSALQPKELWIESGRWTKYGPELMRLKDRNDREFCLGPTHEEIFTSIVRDSIRSYKELPVSLYQIQTKYRDEMRPRFGLIRSREFIMKDAYTFDIDETGLNKSYEDMYHAYERIFTRLHLNFTAVLADTGNIGGNASHQFMALSNIGESTIIYNSNYSADQEKAEAKVDVYNEEKDLKDIQEVSTPNVKTIEDLSKFLNTSPKRIIKAIVYKDLISKELVLCLIRGDREINKIKVANKLGLGEFDLDFATDADFSSTSSVFGFIGPVGLKMKTLVDPEVTHIVNAYCGGNKKDVHLKNVNYKRDFDGEVVDIRLVVAGDLDIVKGEPLKEERGIEVGQVFKLGTKYSKAMNCVYVNDKGQEVPMVMGCYGIGISRALQAIVEEYHDENGISFPDDLAPYKVVIVPVKYTDEVMKNLADKMYDELKSKGVDVILDDRASSLGVKLHDWDLVGIPYHIIVGRDAVNNQVEFKTRRDGNKEVLDVDVVLKKF